MAPRTKKQPAKRQPQANAPAVAKIRRTGLAPTLVRTSGEPIQDLSQKRILSTLSLDILFEIFLAMHPADLLTLARTSKAFRRTLMSRTTQSIWKATHANVEYFPLIPCPPGMSEPELVDLAFGDECYRCGKESDRRDGYLDCKSRYCFRCNRAVMFSIWSGSQKRALDMSRFGSNKKPIELERYLVQRSGKTWVTGFYKPHVDHLESIVECANDEQDCLDSLIAWKNEQRTLQKFAVQLKHWWKKVEHARREARTAARLRRRKAIIKQLKHLGYTEDLKSISGDHSNILVHLFWHFFEPTRDLTLNEWTQMKPSLVAFMEERKALRLKWEQVKTIQTRLAALGNALRAIPARPLPCVVDLASLDDMKAVLERPSDVHVDEATFAELLPDVIDEWRKDVDAQLAHFVLMRLKKAKTTVGAQEPAQLKGLAQLMFTCECGVGLRWAGVVGHHHLYKAYGQQVPTAPGGDGALTPLKAGLCETAVRASFLEKAWSPSSLRLQVCGARAVNVFKAAGLDMASATCAEMDTLDARFECVACGTARRSMLVFDWREAIYHCETAHAGKKPSALNWKLVDADIVAKVKTVSWSVTEDPPWDKLNDRVLVGAHPVWVFSAKLQLKDLSTEEAELLEACGCWCPFPDKRTAGTSRQPAKTAAPKRSRRGIASQASME